MGRPEVVVVTGASAGVGRAIVRRFAEDGAQIGLLARGSEGLEGAREEVKAAGGRAIALPTDVADPQAVEAAAASVEESLGEIDIWINDAMTTVFSFFDEITPDEYKRATEVTYLGTVWGTKAALNRMLPRDRGTIVQVGSAMAYRGIPLQAPYCGAKHAIKGFVESLRCELRNRGSDIHVGMVQLPGLNTPQFDHCLTRLPSHPQPVPPIYQPEVAADAVHWAAHRRRREVYVGIPAVYTIFGNKVASSLAERYLAKSAVSSQQTQEPVDPDRPSNLYEPVAGDPGAHGEFDDQAHGHSVQLWATKHRRGLALAGAAGAAAATMLAASR
ncbi:MAG: SDR family oxidoreductase [Actinomycetota bacterium]|nr:SDR family oxidoreductase [Actinomycetota bacterium]